MGIGDRFYLGVTINIIIVNDRITSLNSSSLDLSTAHMYNHVRAIVFDWNGEWGYDEI